MKVKAWRFERSVDRSHVRDLVTLTLDVETAIEVRSALGPRIKVGSKDDAITNVWRALHDVTTHEQESSERPW